MKYINLIDNGVRVIFVELEQQEKGNRVTLLSSQSFLSHDKSSYKINFEAKNFNIIYKIFHIKLTFLKIT